MLPFREVLYMREVIRDTECVLGADIGGTNANFGIFVIVDHQLILMLSIHFKSQEITDFVSVVHQLLDHLKNSYGITIKKGCFAAAGVVLPNKDYCKPTNLKFSLDSKLLITHTSLDCAPIVNDFEVIGHGIARVAPADIVEVKRGIAMPHGARAIIGAGTGLGKCIMHWHKEDGRYLPVPSEGGHADLAVQSRLELDLAEFIRATEHRNCAISWEDVLSGSGMQRTWRFFNARDRKNGETETNVPHPDEIFKNRGVNQHSWDTFIMYMTLYARCAKNFALDALALNGVYIAGGIASHNVELFKTKEFHQEFVNCGKQGELLRSIPIYVIKDYNVSLYGAVEYLVLHKLCMP